MRNLQQDKSTNVGAEEALELARQGRLRAVGEQDVKLFCEELKSGRVLYTSNGLQSLEGDGRDFRRGIEGTFQGFAIKGGFLQGKISVADGSTVMVPLDPTDPAFRFDCYLQDRKVALQVNEGNRIVGLGAKTGSGIEVVIADIYLNVPEGE